MREPDWMQRQGARPSLPPAPRRRHPGWLIAGGVLAVGLVGLLVALARNILFASVATVVVVTTTPGLSPTAATPTPTSASTFNQQLDAYINSLSQQQQIGQLLMLSVYTNAYSAALDGPLRQGQVGSVIFFPNHNGGPLMPTTLAGVKQLISDLKAHATTPLLVATDEEGGLVDRLQYYFGPTPSPQALSASGNPQNAYNQAALDAQRMKQLGINLDFAPLADVYQGGAIDRSRMFGTTTQDVITYAGAFLDGLQQHGVAGTLKHWPGIGAVPANPDFGLPTLNHSKTQLNNTDFATFRALLSHQPDLIMVTHVLVPAYDPNNLASLSPTLINGVLRGQLGYQGVVVSDAMEAASVTQYMQQQGYSNPAQAVGEASVRAILAGEDLIECPVDPTLAQGVIDAVTRAVISGRITPARLQQSLRRIIALKVRLGILTLPPA
ncbi:MAG TPA: glycoside hydrolase family 3 N-terminal domain-containing protein [Ktedonobacterales bacterium]